jgi:hypothetical protein
MAATLRKYRFANQLQTTIYKKKNNCHKRSKIRIEHENSGIQVFFVADAFKFIFCIRASAILRYKRPEKKSKYTLPHGAEYGSYQIKNQQ